MALELRRWVGSAALGCGLVSLLLVPPAREVTPDWWDAGYDSPAREEYQDLMTRSYEARWKVRPALEYLTLLERRDSAFAHFQLRGENHDGSPVVLIDRGLPPVVRNATESAVDRQWQAISQSPSNVPVVVSVQLDTMDITLDMPRRLGLGLHLGYALPTDQSMVCFSILKVGARTAQRMAALVQQPEQGEVTLANLLPTSAPELLGPCAYYTAFGMPGATIASWLETVNYGPAILPTWVRDPPYRDAAKMYRTRQGWPSEYRNVDLYPCASGELSRCKTAVLSEIPDLFSFRYPIEFATPRPSGIVNASRFAWPTTHPLGIGVRSYLADLVTEMGRDRFSLFWTSGEPVEIAFAKAFGLPLEDWTQQWAREQVGTPLRGPATSLGALLQGFLLATLFVGGGLLYGSRREVG